MFSTAETGPESRVSAPLRECGPTSHCCGDDTAVVPTLRHGQGSQETAALHHSAAGWSADLSLVGEGVRGEKRQHKTCQADVRVFMAVGVDQMVKRMELGMER